MSRIAVLGTGKVGDVLADGFLKHGHEVMRGSREPSKLAEWRKGAGPRASTGTFAEAAKWGELVVLAVKGAAAESVLDLVGASNLAGKVVIEVPQLLEGSVCGAFIDVAIPIKTTKKGDKPNKAGVKLSATAPKGTKPRKDKDKFELICNPCAGSASGAFLD